MKEQKKNLFLIKQYRLRSRENLHKIDQLLCAYERSLQINQEYQNVQMRKYAIKLRTIYNKMKRANEHNKIKKEKKYLEDFYKIIKKIKNLES